MPRLPLILSLCLLLPYAPAPTTAAGPRDSLVVSTAWLAAHLHDPNLVILHVGDKARYDSKHIPGARRVALADISVSDHSATGLMLEMPPAEELRHGWKRLGCPMPRARSSCSTRTGCRRRRGSCSRSTTPAWATAARSSTAASTRGRKKAAR